MVKLFDEGKDVVVPVHPKEVGEFCRSIAGNSPDVSALAGRLLEEAAELGIACGLTVDQIFGHIADSVYNQAVKESYHSGETVFPSGLRRAHSIVDMAGECADVVLMAKRLAFEIDVDLDAVERRVFEDFKTRDLYANEKGLIYARKPHVK